MGRQTGRMGLLRGQRPPADTETQLLPAATSSRTALSAARLPGEDVDSGRKSITLGVPILGAVGTCRAAGVDAEGRPRWSHPLEVRRETAIVPIGPMKGRIRAAGGKMIVCGCVETSEVAVVGVVMPCQTQKLSPSSMRRRERRMIQPFEATRSGYGRKCR